MSGKGYHSLKVQIVCNAQLQISNIVAKYPGSAHDSFIWRTSNLRALLSAREFHGSRLIGDSGYSLEPWLLTPITDPNTPGKIA